MQVDYNQLLSARDTIQEIYSQLNSLATEMKSIVDSLSTSGAWDSNSSGTFIKNFESVYNSFEGISESLNNVVSYLNGVYNSYESVESLISKGW